MAAPLAVGPGSLSFTSNTDLPVPLKKFYQGEPLALGITQIFIGIIGIIFGILLSVIDDDSMIYTILKVPFWSGILYIISGSLAVAAARNPKISLVQGTLAMNVISAVIAATGIICLLLTMGVSFMYRFMYYCHHFEELSQETCQEIVNIVEGILAVLLVFTILEFCIAISLASFGCKMLCRNAFTETVVVIYQNVTPTSAEHPPIDCKQPVSP